MNNFKEKEVWFVTGSQHLYGPGPLKQVAEDSQKIAKGLSDSDEISVKVVYKPTVTTPDEISQVCIEANSSPNCIGLITWMHTFSPAKMWIAGLNTLNKPFVHLHTQFNRDIPWSSIDMDFMNLNQSAHGGREFGFIASRMRIDRKVVVGFWQDPEVLSELGVWVRAALAWEDAQNLKIARIGDNMREVAVTEGDKVTAQMQFGYSVNGYGLGDLVAYISLVSDAEIDQLLQAYEGQYNVQKDLRPGGARQNDLRETARIELALRAFLARPGCAAVDGRRLRVWRGRRLENSRYRSRDESDVSGIGWGHILYGRLHLSLRAKEKLSAWRAYVRNLQINRDR
jgi:L-arabinose isomerase